MSDSRINCCELAKKRFDDYLYSEYKMNTDGFIKHIKSIPEDERDSELFSVLQAWIDWLVDSFDLNSGSVKIAFSGLNKYLRYHRIKITREDSNEEIEYPDEIREEKYPLSDDEIQLIIPSLMWKNQGFCVGLASGGMRPQELMDLDDHELSYLTRINLKDKTEQEEIWRCDTIIALRIAELQTEVFGKLVCIQTTREKVSHLIFFVEKQIIYITFDTMDSKQNLELSCKIHNYIQNISQKIEHLVHEKVSSPQHDLEIKQESV